MRMCVYCKFRYKKGSTISFHKIPTDPSMRRMWLQKMKVCNWSPKEKDALCSKHFDVSCFVEHNNRRSLKPGSVPTIFEGNFDESGMEVKIGNSDDVIRGNEMDMKEPKTTISSYGYKNAYHPSSTNGNIHSSSSPPSKQPPNRLNNVSNTEDSSITTASNNDHDYKTLQTLKKSRIQYSVAHDHQYESTPRSYKNAVQHAKKSLQVSNARIKVLTQCVRRLRNKVTSLASVIHDLSKGDLRKMYEIDVESTL